MAETPALCRHLHLPVQSGSNRILQAMNRRYTRESYLTKVEKIRHAAPDVGLTTDIIVAFPGEEDQDFEDTMDLVRTVGYDSAFTFIYSPRVGTRAAEMPGRIDPALATERIERLIALQEEMTQKRFAEMIGKTEQVLVTGFSRRNEAQVTGKTSRNISVNFEGNESLAGKIVNVKITEASKTTLRGEAAL